MTAPRAQIDPRFSTPDATATPWSEVVEVIEGAEIFWLSTVRSDGRPHVTPLPAIWLDGALHFCTGPGEQKTVNMGRDPRCALTTGTDRLRTGLDVVAEGSVELVTDLDLLDRLARIWKSKLDWDFTAVEGGFLDGDHATELTEVALVFALAPTKVLAFSKGEPFAQTRYTF